MQIDIMSPEDLVPYEKNPRINDKAVDSVAKSIEQFGFNQPVVVDQTNTICVGHTRWKAALKLGLKTIPVYKRKMSEKEFIAYNIADNRTSENAKWDQELLQMIIQELDTLDEKFLEFTGFTDSELSDMLDEQQDIDPWKSDKEKVEKKGSNLDGIKACIKIFCDKEIKKELQDYLQTKIYEKNYQNVTVE